ncbi:Retrovirus-related Pol polyprotein from transposon RE1, partial [Pseudolycoriella hygida]
MDPNVQHIFASAPDAEHLQNIHTNIAAIVGGTLATLPSFLEIVIKSFSAIVQFFMLHVDDSYTINVADEHVSDGQYVSLLRTLGAHFDEVEESNLAHYLTKKRQRFNATVWNPGDINKFIDDMVNFCSSISSHGTVNTTAIKSIMSNLVRSRISLEAESLEGFETIILYSTRNQTCGVMRIDITGTKFDISGCCWGQGQAIDITLEQTTFMFHNTQDILQTGRDDYDSWKFVVQAYMEAEDLWSIVNGTSTENDENKKRELESKARGKIAMLVEPINYSHIREAKTAKETWDCLEKAYADKGFSRQVSLLRELVGIKLENSKSMDDYLNRIVSCVHKLKGAGSVIQDELVAAFMMAGLTEEYRPMIMGIESINTKITSEDIKTKLLQEVSISRRMDHRFRCNSVTNKKSINENVIIANDSKLNVEHVGDVKLQLKVNDSPVDAKIDDALHVPELFTNLLSVSILVKKGLTVTFDISGCKITNKQNKLIAKGSLVGDVFKLDQWKDIAAP